MLGLQRLRLRHILCPQGAFSLIVLTDMEMKNGSALLKVLITKVCAEQNTTRDLFYHRFHGKSMQHSSSSFSSNEHLTQPLLLVFCSSVTMGTCSIIASYNGPRNGYQVSTVEHLGETQFITAKEADCGWLGLTPSLTQIITKELHIVTSLASLQGCPNGLLCLVQALTVQPHQARHRFVVRESMKESYFSSTFKPKP